MTCIAEVTELASGHRPTRKGKVLVKAAPPCSLWGLAGHSGSWDPALGEGQEQVALAAGAWGTQT